MRTTTTTTSIARSGLALAAIPLILIGLAACSNDSGSGTGHEDSSSMSESDKKAAAHEFDLAVAKCIRDKGFDSPDPDANGGGQALELKDGQDPNAVFAAAQDCQTSVEKQLGKRPVTAAEKKLNEAAEKKNAEQNACLKENGYDLSEAAAGAGAPEGAMISASGDSGIPEDVLEKCGMSGGSGVSTGGGE